MTWETAEVLWATTGAAVVGLIVGVFVHRWTARRRNSSSPHHTTAGPTVTAERFAFVANPSKVDVTGMKLLFRRMFADAALPEPTWFTTTVEEPGTSQAREAIAQGADVVVAVGGDGTVRAVAAAMVNTGRTMGLVPVGTGNLLARNLDLPVADPAAALRVVVAGSDRQIDVGWVVISPRDDHPTDPATPRPHRPSGEAPSEERHIFLVIAGLGFDAAMVADTDATLKARVGWMAYFIGGIRHLHGRRLHARIEIDDRAPLEARLRTLLIGNCGRLPGGITLLPGAVIDDGILDIAAIDTRGGLVGWAQVFGEVVMQGFGLRNELPARIGRIDHLRAHALRARVDAEVQVQLDGDVVGTAQGMAAWVEPGALIVRTPVLVSSPRTLVP